MLVHFFLVVDVGSFFTVCVGDSHNFWGRLVYFTGTRGRFQAVKELPNSYFEGCRIWHIFTMRGPEPFDTDKGPNDSLYNLQRVKEEGVLKYYWLHYKIYLTLRNKGAKAVPLGNCLKSCKRAPKQCPYGKVPQMKRAMFSKTVPFFKQNTILVPLGHYSCMDHQRLPLGHHFGTIYFSQCIIPAFISYSFTT